MEKWINFAFIGGLTGSANKIGRGVCRTALCRQAGLEGAPTTQLAQTMQSLNSLLN